MQNLTLLFGFAIFFIPFFGLAKDVPVSWMNTEKDGQNQAWTELLGKDWWSTDNTSQEKTNDSGESGFLTHSFNRWMNEAMPKIVDGFTKTQNFVKENVDSAIIRFKEWKNGDGTVKEEEKILENEQGVPAGSFQETIQQTGQTFLKASLNAMANAKNYFDSKFQSFNA